LAGAQSGCAAIRIFTAFPVLGKGAIRHNDANSAPRSSMGEKQLADVIRTAIMAAKIATREILKG
jgi:hypothetical protein